VITFFEYGLVFLVGALGLVFLLGALAGSYVMATMIGRAIKRLDGETD
jgi:hypothetical protein